MSATVSGWVGFADEDRRIAELAYHEGIWNQTCLHAQQCVEKMLKAALAERGTVTPHLHRLSDLLGLLAPDVIAALTALVADIRSLDRFYIANRYPDALPGTLATGLPGEAEATGALDVAKEVQRCVLELLR